MLSDLRIQISTAQKDQDDKLVQLLNALIRRVKKLHERHCAKAQSQHIWEVMNKNLANFKDEPGIEIHKLKLPFRKLVIDRALITSNDDSIVLTTEPAKVQEQASKQFKHQFKKCYPRLENLPLRWLEVYDAASHPNPDIYATLLKPITMEEIDEALRSKKSSSAPGPSQIPYSALKQLGYQA